MYYILATEFGEVSYKDPHAVNAMYNRAESATLYKVSDQGNMEIIKSK